MENHSETNNKVSDNKIADTNLKENNSTDIKVEENFLVCPCCKKPTLEKPVEIKDELLDRYLSCIITGVPFSYSYNLYKNKLVICITELTEEERIAISEFNTISKILSARLNAVDEEVLKRLLNIVSIYARVSIVSTNSSDAKADYFPKKYVFETINKVKDLFKNSDNYKDKELYDLIASINVELSKYIPQLQPDLILSVLTSHNLLLRILSKAGEDENFIEGIEFA